MAIQKPAPDDLFLLNTKYADFVFQNKGQPPAIAGDSALTLLILLAFYIPILMAVLFLLTQPDGLEAIEGILIKGDPIPPLGALVKIVLLLAYVVFVLVFTPFAIRKARTEHKPKAPGQLIYGKVSNYKQTRDSSNFEWAQVDYQFQSPLTGKSIDDKIDKFPSSVIRIPKPFENGMPCVVWFIDDKTYRLL